MALQDTIEDIQARLKRREYANEDEITQKVVRRLLHELGWDIFGTQVRGQFTVTNGFVDVALLADESKPDIFIEVKQHGKLEGADEQVFGYAFHRGVPFVIVTDGQEWHFYLSDPAKGSYDERKVYNLDLLEREPSESEYRLLRYMSHAEVANRNALRSAQDDHENATKKRKAERSIPEAWVKLLDTKDDKLLELVTEQVEALCGYRPEPESVFAHLRGLGKLQSKPQLQTKIASPSAKERRATGRKTTSSRPGGKRPPETLKVEFRDRKGIHEQQGKDSLIATIRAIGFERVRALNIKMRDFPLVSTEKHMPDTHFWTGTGDGYFVYTASSTADKKKQLEQISDRLNLDLVVRRVKK